MTLVNISKNIGLAGNKTKLVSILTQISIIINSSKNMFHIFLLKQEAMGTSFLKWVLMKLSYRKNSLIIIK